MHSVELHEISKQFNSGRVLHAISFRIEAGQRVAVVGESGSGKTTLLRIIAGLEQPTQGRVKLDGVDVTSQPASRRGIGVVFQDYATYPRLSVAENLSVSIVGGGIDRAEKEGRLKEIVGWLGLEGLLKRMPAELSGGQLQRVALGKALMARPKILLLDEPFSQLDVRLADQLRRLLDECHQRFGMTQITVTHLPMDALCTADKLAVLHKGELVQFETPEVVRTQPKTLFAAELTSPCGLNVLPSAVLPALGLPIHCMVAFRPESIRLCEQGVDPANFGVVRLRCRLGGYRELGIVRLREALVAGHRIWIASGNGPLEASVDTEVECWLRRDDVLALAE